MSMDTKIAITGASGHIGTVLVPKLISKGFRIKALVYRDSISFDSDRIERVKGSLKDANSLKELVSGCKIVIHCAARISINSNKDPLVYEINVSGTKNIFTAARNQGVKRFIHLSSIHAFDQLTREEVLNESTQFCSDRAPLYDRSKRDSEKFILGEKTDGMEVIVINPTSVIGPHDIKPSLMGKAIMDIYNRKVPMLIKGGFDFCDVRDVADGIISSIEKGRSGEKYLLSGSWHSLKDLQNFIISMKESNAKLPVLPIWFARIGLPFIRFWSYMKHKEPLYTKESILALAEGHKNINSKKAEEELGYVCRPVKDTIRDSVQWFRQAGKL
jgi:dihydroflavonol-4-reductase